MCTVQIRNRFALDALDPLSQTSLPLTPTKHQPLLCGPVATLSFQLNPLIRTSLLESAIRASVSYAMVHMELFLPMGSTGYEIYWPVALGGLFLLTAIYKLLVYPALISPLSKVPNAHWSAPFSATWILWIRFTNYENREVQHAHLEKGPVVRLGPNEISVNCVDGGIRTVYGGGFEKRDWYSIFDNYG